MPRRPSNRHIRNAIREIIEPRLMELGFTGKYPEFRREWECETHFILFQTAKYGGSFSYSAAWRRRLPYLSHNRPPIPPEEVSLAHTEFDDRASAVRVVPFCLIDSQRSAWRSVGWFDYSYLVENEGDCRALVAEAAALLPALDHWLKTREAGLGVDCKGHRMRLAQSPTQLWHSALRSAGVPTEGARPPMTPHLDAQRAANEAPEYWMEPE
ncbi:hypothetical protein [Altererythrobacter sp. GH1-8]|uniref:hypothetical protein n=1 Tax=Altererythrobacter sp. GH1-8 TaxID=3349333 RepID=UPI00374CA2DF